MDFFDLLDCALLVTNELSMLLYLYAQLSKAGMVLLTLPEHEIPNQPDISLLYLWLRDLHLADAANPLTPSERFLSDLVPLKSCWIGKKPSNTDNGLGRIKVSRFGVRHHLQLACVKK